MGLLGSARNKAKAKGQSKCLAVNLFCLLSRFIHHAGFKSRRVLKKNNDRVTASLSFFFFIRTSNFGAEDERSYIFLFAT